MFWPPQKQTAPLVAQTTTTSATTSPVFGQPIRQPGFGDSGYFSPFAPFAQKQNPDCFYRSAQKFPTPSNHLSFRQSIESTRPACIFEGTIPGNGFNVFLQITDNTAVERSMVGFNTFNKAAQSGFGEEATLGGHLNQPSTSFAQKHPKPVLRPSLLGQANQQQPKISLNISFEQPDAEKFPTTQPGNVFGPQLQQSGPPAPTNIFLTLTCNPSQQPSSFWAPSQPASTALPSSFEIRLSTSFESAQTSTFGSPNHVNIKVDVSEKSAGFGTTTLFDSTTKPLLFGQTQTQSASGFGSPFAQPQKTGFPDKPSGIFEGTIPGNGFSVFLKITDNTALGQPVQSMVKTSHKVAPSIHAFNQRHQLKPVLKKKQQPCISLNMSFEQQDRPTTDNFPSTQPLSFFAPEVRQSLPPYIFGTFGQSSGTVIKFTPVMNKDVKSHENGTTLINTKAHCITVMDEYERKSLEELRYEDYAANRKGHKEKFGFWTPPQQPFGFEQDGVPNVHNFPITQPGNVFGPQQQSGPGTSTNVLFPSTFSPSQSQAVESGPSAIPSSFVTRASTNFGSVEVSSVGTPNQVNINVDVFGKPAATKFDTTNAPILFGQAHTQTKSFTPFAPFVQKLTKPLGTFAQHSILGTNTSELFGSTNQRPKEGQQMPLYTEGITCMEAKQATVCKECNEFIVNARMDCVVCLANFHIRCAARNRTITVLDDGAVECCQKRSNNEKTDEETTGTKANETEETVLKTMKEDICAYIDSLKRELNLKIDNIKDDIHMNIMANIHDTFKHGVQYEKPTTTAESNTTEVSSLSADSCLKSKSDLDDTNSGNKQIPLDLENEPSKPETNSDRTLTDAATTAGESHNTLGTTFSAPSSIGTENTPSFVAPTKAAHKCVFTNATNDSSIFGKPVAVDISTAANTNSAIPGKPVYIGRTTASAFEITNTTSSNVLGKPAANVLGTARTPTSIPSGNTSSPDISENPVANFFGKPSLFGAPASSPFGNTTSPDRSENPIPNFFGKASRVPASSPFANTSPDRSENPIENFFGKASRVPASSPFANTSPDRSENPIANFFGKASRIPASSPFANTSPDRSENPVANFFDKANLFRAPAAISLGNTTNPDSLEKLVFGTTTSIPSENTMTTDILEKPVANVFGKTSLFGTPASIPLENATRPDILEKPAANVFGKASLFGAPGTIPSGNTTSTHILEKPAEHVFGKASLFGALASNPSGNTTNPVSLEKPVASVFGTDNVLGTQTSIPLEKPIEHAFGTTSLFEAPASISVGNTTSPDTLEKPVSSIFEPSTSIFSENATTHELGTTSSIFEQVNVGNTTSLDTSGNPAASALGTSDVFFGAQSSSFSEFSTTN